MNDSKADIAGFGLGPYIRVRANFLIQRDVLDLGAHRAVQEQILRKQIGHLSDQIAALSQPARFRKSDMNRWRELLEIYLQTEIFFSTRERDHGIKTPEEAEQRVRRFSTTGNVCSSILISS